MLRPSTILKSERSLLKLKPRTATALSLVLVFLNSSAVAQEVTAPNAISPEAQQPAVGPADKETPVPQAAPASDESAEETPEGSEPTGSAGTPPRPETQVSAEPVEKKEMLSGPAAPPQTNAPPEPASEASKVAAPPTFRTMLLVEGVAKYGAITLADPASVEQPDVEADTDSAGLFGAQATLGLMPGGSTFMLAGRLRAGSYIRTAEAIPTVGAEVLFGASFLRKPDGKSFSYLLGGMGVEYLPTNNQDLLTLHAVGGSVVRGLHFGGGLHIGGNDEFAVFMFGLHLGWGQLFY